MPSAADADACGCTRDVGRILSAYGGIFVAWSITWGMVADGYRPDRFDVIGALICLTGMTVIMYTPRSPLIASTPVRHPGV